MAATASFIRPSVPPDLPTHPPHPRDPPPASLRVHESAAASANPRPLLTGQLQTDYIASLLQRVAPAPDLSRPSPALSAYQTRDLLQSRSNLVGRLRGERGAAEGPLAVAHSVLQWQLRSRGSNAAAWGAPAPHGGGALLPASALTAAPPAPTAAPPAPTAAPTAYASTSSRAADAISRQGMAAALKDAAWLSYRTTQRAAATAEIQGRRRPQTVYYEKPAIYAPSVQGQLASLSTRQARAAAAARGGEGEGGSGGGEGGEVELQAPLGGAALPPPAASQNLSPTALAFAALMADPNAVVAAPHRQMPPKRLTQPIVLRPSTAPAGATSGAAAQLAPRPTRRAPLLDWWQAPEDAGGCGGALPIVPPHNSTVFHASPAASVIAQAGKLLDRFARDGEADAGKALAAAARFSGSSSKGSGTGRRLPDVEQLSHALRPATAVGGRGRGGAGGDSTAAQGGHARPPSAAAAAPPKGVSAEPEVPPHPQQFVGGLLYAQHPLDAAAEREELRERILKDLAKQAKAKAAEGKAAKA